MKIAELHYNINFTSATRFRPSSNHNQRVSGRIRKMALSVYVNRTQMSPLELSAQDSVYKVPKQRDGQIIQESLIYSLVNLGYRRSSIEVWSKNIIACNVCQFVKDASLCESRRSWAAVTMKQISLRGSAATVPPVATFGRSAVRPRGGCSRPGGWFLQGCAGARGEGRTLGKRGTITRWGLQDWRRSLAAYQHRRHWRHPTFLPASRHHPNMVTGGSPLAGVRSRTPRPGLPCSVRTFSSACREITFRWSSAGVGVGTDSFSVISTWEIQAFSSNNWWFLLNIKFSDKIWKERKKRWSQGLFKAI